MTTQLRRLAAVAAAAALAACGDADPLTPTGAAPDGAVPNAADARPSLDISDARVAKPTGFYFATPIAATLASYPGTFDGTRTPTVEICRWVTNACSGAQVATYTRTTGTGGATIAVDAAAQLYRVDWPTTGLPNTNVYRIRVLDGSLELGHADAKVLAPGETAAGLLAQGIVALGNSPRLAIRFRIEQNQAPVVAITAPAENAVLTAGVPATFAGTATDAEEGNVGSQIVWRSNQLPSPIGTGTSLSAMLPSGRNTISASVTDSRGATTTVTRQVVVSIVSVPATLNVPFGGTASLPITLAEPAPAGGMTLTVASSQPGNVGVQSATVTIPAGQQSANATLSGVAPGTAVVTVANADYGSATSQVATTASLNVGQTSVSFAAGRSEQITIELESQGADIAAPSGGLQVSLSAANPACVAAPATVTIPAGLVSTTATLTYAGTAATPCTSNVTASVAGMPSIATDVVAVTVNPEPILTTDLTSATALGAGLIRGPYNVNFAAPVPSGGVVVTLRSTAPAAVELSANASTVGVGEIAIPVAGGATSVAFYIQGVPASTGSGRVEVSAPGYRAATTAFVTTIEPVVQLAGVDAATTSLSADDDFYVQIGLPSGAAFGNAYNVRPGHSVAVTVKNGNAAVAQLKKQGSAPAQEFTVTIAAGQSNTPTSFGTGGLALDPLNGGTTTVTATSDQAAEVATATRSVTVSAPALTTDLTSAISLGAGLIRGPYNVYLGAAAPAGGVEITLKSSNPTAMTLSRNTATVGTEEITLTIAAGSTSGAFYVQGIEGHTGSATVSATASAYYTPATSATVTVIEPVIQLAGVDAATTSLSADDDFYVQIGLPSGASFGNAYNVRPGHSVAVTVKNGNAAVAQLKKQGSAPAQEFTVTIAAGQSNSPTSFGTGGLALDPLNGGTTTVTATSDQAAAVATATRSVTVSAPALTTDLSSAISLGAGLIRGPYNVYLGAAAPAGGVEITLKSSNPAAMTLSRNTATIGTEEITLTIAAGSTSGAFYVQGIEGHTGSATVSATASAYYTPATSATVTVVEPVIQLASVDASTTVLSNDDDFYVQIGLPSGAAFGNAYNVRPGNAVEVTIRNSQSAVARLKRPGNVSGQEFTLTIAAGQSNTATSLAAGGIALDPLATGTTTLTATSDEAVEVATATRQVTVSTPGMTMDLGSASVGAGLIRGPYSVTLGAPAPTGGAAVTIRSSAASVLALSKDAATVGTGEITVTVGAGSQTASFYLQGVENQTGTVTITATAEGFTDAVGTASVVKPILDITGLASSMAASAADDPFQVRVGLPSGGAFGNSYNVRPGGSLVVTVESATPAVGTLKTTAGSAATVTVTIPAGSSTSAAAVASGGVAFDPLAPGTTSVSISAGALPTTGARTVTVQP